MTHLHGTRVDWIKILRKIILLKGKRVTHKVYQGVLIHTHQMCEIGSAKNTALPGLEFKLNSGAFELANV